MINLTNKENIRHYEAMPPGLIENFGEEGDFARQHLLNPAISRLAGSLAGKTVLDAGCGQGYLARLLAKRGARVSGLEPTGAMLDYALERERQEKLGINYVRADLSAYDGFGAQFDLVVSNMVLMDIPAYEKAIANCLAWLKPGGSFIFSISHPCFEDSYRDFMAKSYAEVSEYLSEYLIRQDYGYRIHRPLSHYLNAVIRQHGLVKEVVEPQLDPVQPFAENERDRHVPSFIVIHAVKWAGF